ncbi:MAG: histidinol-phosphatase HisJ family protein [Erysipelotrichaceae bacterium]|nr:histidinol-phosphatase HisJ family protein [Erysipelotrichaceae bacterium]
MFCDYHVHSEFSDDSFYPMEEVVQDAIKMGMEEICFTDHVDYGVKKDWDDPEGIEYRGGTGESKAMPLANVNYPKYFEKLQTLQQKYPQITIRKGMEFGMQTHTVSQFQKLFDSYPFDFIILSCHQVEDNEFWTGDFQRNRTQLEYNLRYYQEILDVIREYKDYSVLGHLDLIIRYDEKGALPFEKTKDIVTKILKTVIRDGKGIEVNTSSHRYGLEDLEPSRAILSLYKELGGTIITIGSDSHKKEHLGAYIEQTKAELKELGFTRFATYEKMKPVFHSLV